MNVKTDAGQKLIFERDLVEANERIIISSPDIEIRKIDRLLSIIKKRQENGVKVASELLEIAFKHLK